MSLLEPEALAGSDLDIYYHPAYLRSVQPDGDLRVLVRDDLILPLVVRPLPEWLGRPDLRDAESPYGYAAAITRGTATAVDWAGAAEELAAHGIVNAFLRGHPLQPWVGPPAMLSTPTAVIPLADGRDEAFAGARCANHRSQVNRAKKQGFSAEICENPQDLAGFRQLYERTMERLEAAAFYHFGDAAWAALSGLGDRLALVTVRDGSGIIHNQALFLRGPRWAHYHLSARSDEAHNAAGNLLFEAAADWAVVHGCTAIHLGGGTTGREDDGLLGYKRRIGRADATFCAAGVIADRNNHESLVAAWRQRTGGNPRWFQAYRQPQPGG